MVNEDNALQGALSETQQQLGQTIDKVTNDRSQLNNINKIDIYLNYIDKEPDSFVDDLYEANKNRCRI